MKADSFWALSRREDEGPTARLLWLPDTGRPTAIRLVPNHSYRNLLQGPNGLRLVARGRSDGRFTQEVIQLAEPDPAAIDKLVAGDNGQLRLADADTAGAGKIIRGKIHLLPEHAADLNRRLDEVGLWSAPATVAGDPTVATRVKGLWVLEGVEQGHYHLLVGGSAADPVFDKISEKMFGYARMIPNIRISP